VVKTAIARFDADEGDGTSRNEFAFRSLPVPKLGTILPEVPALAACRNFKKQFNLSNYKNARKKCAIS